MGECMDANLEEKNKDSKEWQHGGMTALDWLRISHNVGNLTSGSVSTVFYFITVKSGLKIQFFPSSWW